MTAEDLSKVQEEFAKAVSESATRLASAWKDAVQSAAGAQAFGTSPPSFPDVADRTSAGLQEIMRAGGKDLPELVRSLEDSSALNRITGRWLESYESAMRASLGIPPPSVAEQAISQWKRTIQEFSSRDPRTSMGMLPRLFPWIDAFSPAKPPDTPKEALDLWFQGCEWLLGAFTPTRRPMTAGDYRSRAIQAIDAQIRYANELPAVNTLIAQACKKTVTQVVDTIRAGGGPREMSDDLYRLFHKTWIAANEQIFTALLKSDDFGQPLARMIREGLDAKSRVESVLTELLGFFDVPPRKEFDQALLTIRTLEERLGRVEQELDALKKLLRKEGQTHDSVL
ncbi:MAG: poly(R)-hydroxyalkanoic acid synthase subunit PhaE [Thermodesulfobacteriota bacterium]